MSERCAEPDGAECVNARPFSSRGLRSGPDSAFRFHSVKQPAASGETSGCTKNVLPDVVDEVSSCVWTCCSMSPRLDRHSTNLASLLAEEAPSLGDRSASVYAFDEHRAGCTGTNTLKTRARHIASRTQTSGSMQTLIGQAHLSVPAKVQPRRFLCTSHD